MTTKTQYEVWYDFALQQVAADSYLDAIDWNDQASVTERLMLGNNDLRPTVFVNGQLTENLLRREHPTSNKDSPILPGASRLTLAQADYFFQNWKIVDHRSNDASGFSATVLQNRSTNEYTLAFRSTEFADQAHGGDRERDLRFESTSAADYEIALDGFAFAQLSAMERYWNELRDRGALGEPNGVLPGAILNVTGYSLGGHLATVFAELHSSAVNKVYLFNAAGRGGWSEPITSIRSIIDLYGEMLIDPDAYLLAGISVPETVESGVLRSFALADQSDPWASPNIYRNARHQWANYVLERVTRGVVWESIFPGGQHVLPAAEAKIEYVYGMGSHNDETYVTNSGITPLNKTLVFIEDQAGEYPASEPQPDGTVRQEDFARTHSITLIVDSLAVGNLLQKFHPTLTRNGVDAVLTAASNQTGKDADTFEDTRSETDSLERVVDALWRILKDGSKIPIETAPDGFGHLGNRNILHDRIAQLSEVASHSIGKYEIRPLVEINWEPVPTWTQTIARSLGSYNTVLTSLNKAEILQKTRQIDAEGLAYRYALHQLNPFVLLGADYSAFNGSGELDQFNANTGRGLTQLYLESRVEQLAWLLQINVNDESARKVVPGMDAVTYEDLGLGKKIELVPSEATIRSVKVIFAGNEPAEAVGGLFDDRLFGGAGKDTLGGNEGGDFLEGGAGLDKLDGGAGSDTLFGVDGSGGDVLIGGSGFDTYRPDFGDIVIDTPESSGSGAIYVYVDGESTQLTGGRRDRGQPFYTSDDGRLKYWADSRGGIAVFPTSVSVGDRPLIIQAPIAPVPGLSDTATESVRGRPDLGIALREMKDPDKPRTPSLTSQIKSLWDQARTWVPFSDPLALDLQGDGFQTVGDLGAGTVLFDHDGNGVRNGTGWLSGADAWVALDRDGDGLIASGKELFGVDTVLSDGTTGANGFAAIAPMDTNGDGKIDASDLPLDGWQVPADVDGDGIVGQDETRGAIFGDLQLWRDENLNGVSEPWELSRLADAAVVSINLDQIPAGQALPGGNALAFRGTYSKDDGTTGTAGALDLTRETFYREYSEAPAYAPGVEELPAMSGSGRVRDLQEAAADSPALRQAIEIAAAEAARADQYGAIQEVVHEWAAASSMGSGTISAASRPDGAVLVYSIPGTFITPVQDAYLAAGGGGVVDPATLAAGWYADQQSQEYQDRVALIETLERFVGQTFVDVDRAQSSIAATGFIPSEEPGEPGTAYAVRAINTSLRLENWQFLQDADALLKEAAYGGIAVQTRLLPYVRDATAGAALRDFSLVEESLSHKRAIDPAGALVDIIDVARFLGTDFIDRGWTGLPLMVGEWVREARLDPALAATLDTMQVQYRSDYGIHGTAVGDVLVGTPWEPPFPSPAIPTVHGGYGDDLVFSDGDFEILFGGPGNDIIHGGVGDEIIAPGLGRDIIMFGRGSGVDQVDSSRDPDILSGLASATLLPATDRDIVHMLPDVTPDDVRVRWMAAPHYAYTGPFSGGYLSGVRLSIIGTNDALYDAGFSVGGTTSNNARSIEEVRFQDGTTWDLATLRLKQIEGSESNDRAGEAGFLRGFDDLDDVIDAKGGDDRLEGLAGDDSLLGGAGNDELLAGHGDDILHGGDGNDLLEGDFGADVLHGGKGDDLLYGGPGVDTYVVGANTGFDTLNLGNALTFGFEPAPLLDVLRFEADVTPSQVRLQRLGSGLHLFVDGADSHVFDIGNPSNPDYTGESFHGPSIGRIEFADGTLWDGAEIKRRSLLGASEGEDRLYGFELSGDEIRGLGGNDLLNGGRGDDSLFGDAGDDTLHGDDGNDLIYGGAGADVLVGGSGIDTIVFGPGDGDDTAHSIEVLRFTAVNAPDVDAWRASGGLHFQLRATGDTVSVVDGSLTRVEFTDGTAWDQHDLDAIRARGTSGDDYLEGTDGDDVIAGLEGNDQLFGVGGHDELDGGPGQDWMYGGAGDDTFIVDDAFDRVFENPGEDHDRVLSSVSFTLDANVEDLTLTDSAPVSAVGNSLDNVLVGNAASNILDGRLGADVMQGGAGDDQYFVDDPMDTVVELAAEGIDTVFSSVSYTLGANLENLTLEGIGDLSASGNSLDNVLAGNQGANLLRGGAGADWLAGGYGADTYFVAPGDGADVVSDDGSSGDRNVLVLESIFPDQVLIEGALVSNVLLRIGTSGDQVVLLAPEGAGLAVAEILFADGSTWTEEDIAGQLSPPPPPPGTGTEGDDVLLGSEASDFLIGLAGDDVLMGKGGDDVLDGGTDNDSLDGGPGSDIYVFRAGDGVDVVLDEPSTTHYVPSDPDSLFTLYLAGEFNALQFGAGILSSDVSLRVEDGVLELMIGNEGDVVLLPGFNLEDSLGAHPIKAFFFEETGELLAYADLLARGYEVVAGNSAPQLLNGLEDQTAYEDAAFAVTVPAGGFFDPDAGDTLTYSALDLPAWLSFDPDARRFSGTPLQADVGEFIVQLIATDAGGLTVSDEFTIGVVNVNDAPQLVRPIDDQSVTEDSPFAFQVPANTIVDEDPDDALAWFARRADGAVLPAWLTFDTMARTLSGTPANEDVGPLEVQVGVEDQAGLAASSTFTLTVVNVNDAPTVANPIGNLSFEAGSPFAFTVPAGTFADEDAGDALTLSAGLFGGAALPAWLAFDPASATFSGNPGKKENGISRVVLTAMDRAGASVSSEFGLVVEAKAGSTVTGGRGDDALYGGSGSEVLVAKDGNDALFGGEGSDLLFGGKGNDVLQGGEGGDVLHGGKGQNLLDGGSGNDVIFGGQGSSLIIGGTGNDIIHAGRGSDVLLFNRGDGSDTVIADRAGDNTLSFGGGIRYSDLSLSRSGKDLVVNAGGDDRVVLKNWYSGKRSILSLQIVADASSDFDAASANPLQNRRVQNFDFLGLVSAFDQARRHSPGLTSWEVTNALLQFHLSGVDDLALGGDLAYWYGKNRSLAGISLAAAQQAIGASTFGSEAQTLRPFSGLQEGFVKLA